MIHPGLGRIDPTRTTMLRRRFEAEMSRRFAVLKRRIFNLIVVQDAFGLHPKTPFTWNETTWNEDWSYNDPGTQMTQFYRWLNAQISQDIYGSRDDTRPSWTQEYITAAYMKGQDRSFTDLNKPINQKKLDFYKGTRAEFLRSAFFRPVSVDKVKLLAQRTMMEMGGATDSMAQTVTRELVDGLIKGQSPRVVAAQLAAKVDQLGRNRANTIARTETIRAHAEGQLDALEELGMDSVGISVEWSTADDYKVCPKCRSLEGIVIAIDEARGLLPRHPNCRCAFRPANVGEDTDKQIRTKKRIVQSIKQSLGRSKDSWPGRRTIISRKRPKAIIR